MKKLLTVSITFAALAFCLQASALTYTDIQNAGDNGYVTSGGSFGGTFDIVNPGSSTYTISGFPSGNGTFTDKGGYTPGTPISGLTVRFYLTDSSFIPIDCFAVSLDGYATGGIMIGQRATFSFKGGTGVISMLEADGKLNYTVTSILGDFTVKYALLTADTTTSASVPDGGLTVAMLGLGLLALVVVQRRLSPAK